MPVICIGPVCIPWTAFLPIILYLGRPIWNRLSPETQQSISTRWKAVRDWLQVHVWDRLGWKVKEEKRELRKSTSTVSRLITVRTLRAKLGGVVPLKTDDEWATALEFTKETGLAMVVDFTATWCGPCQQIAPFFGTLAAKYAEKALFVKVDVDELADVAQEAGIIAMPTFQVYKNGECADKMSGARQEALEEMVVKAV
ncbi:hypothetical protein AB1Y20_005354 [Prymnesium parvum]|uniref:Thioredoxin domain-containing protein n=1 Tax=Prymnesium parvum TaxID=97485 RepID=A0AB34J414_PRYPA